MIAFINNNPVITILAAIEFSSLIFVLSASIIIILKHCFNFTDLSKELIFFDGLSFAKKIKFALFAITLAFPNKIYVYHGKGFLHSLAVFTIISCGGVIYPPLLLLFLVRVLFLFESLVFVYLFENSPYFNHFIIKNIFNNNSEFCNFFLTACWGNMRKAIFEGAKAASGGTALGYGTKHTRDIEMDLVGHEVSKKTLLKIEELKKSGAFDKIPFSMQQQVELTKIVKEEVIMERTLILKAELIVKKKAISVWDHFFS